MIRLRFNRRADRFRPLRVARKALVHLGVLCALATLSLGAFQCPAAGETDLGPLFDEFQLTLKTGTRSEAVGPLFYDEESGAQSGWALPPIFSSYRDADTESREWDFAYPIITYDRFGPEYRFQIIQLFSFSGGGLQ